MFVKKSTHRIVKKHNAYYVQHRCWFGWKYYSNYLIQSGYKVYTCFPSFEEAVEFLTKKENKKKRKIVRTWEFYIDEEGQIFSKP